jgi:hypothetical protein
MEIERAMRLQQEEDVTMQVLSKFRDNPNSQLFDLQQDLDKMTRKLNPIMEKVETTLQNASLGHRMKN